MRNLVLKAFKLVRTITTPTPYLTLVNDKTKTFCATLNPIKYEWLRRVSDPFPLKRQTFTSFVFWLVCLRLASFRLLLFPEVV